jgi:hypothetical protein
MRTLALILAALLVLLPPDSGPGHADDPAPAALDELRARRREARRCRRHAWRRRAILNHYGRACACCGTTKNLTVDHIHGGGNKHRAQLGEGSYGLYRWLVVNGFPAGFQILCGPCNQSKDDGPSCRIDHAPALAWAAGM